MRTIKSIVRVILRAAREFQEVLNYDEEREESASVGWYCGHVVDPGGKWKFAKGAAAFPVEESLKQHGILGLSFLADGTHALRFLVNKDGILYEYTWNKWRPKPNTEFYNATFYRLIPSATSTRKQRVDLALLIPLVQILMDVQQPLRGALMNSTLEMCPSEPGPRHRFDDRRKWREAKGADVVFEYDRGELLECILIPASLEFTTRPKEGLVKAEVGKCLQPQSWERNSS
jgi:hypothetical protein